MGLAVPAALAVVLARFFLLAGFVPVVVVLLTGVEVVDGFDSLLLSPGVGEFFFVAFFFVEVSVEPGAGLDALVP